MAKVKDPKRVRAGRRSKRKGDAFEREIANTLQDRYGTPGVPMGSREFYRTPLSGGMRREYPGDIVVPEWFPFMLECKSSQRANPQFTDLNLIPELGETHQLLKWWTSESLKALHINKSLLVVFKKEFGSVLCLFSGELRLNAGLWSHLVIETTIHRLLCVKFDNFLGSMNRIDLDQLQRIRSEAAKLTHPLQPASDVPATG